MGEGSRFALPCRCGLVMRERASRTAAGAASVAVGAKVMRRDARRRGVDAQTTARSSPPRPHEELLAVVEGDRVLLTSAGLLQLTGYSRAETSSPEFRAAYLFHPSSSRAPLSMVAREGAYDVLVAPPRAPPVEMKAWVSPLPEFPSGHARAILFVREENAFDPIAMRDRAMRALVAALRSEAAEALHRLRRVDDALATVGASHPEVLAHHAPQLLRARVEASHPLDEGIRHLERGARGLAGRTLAQ